MTALVHWTSEGFGTDCLQRCVRCGCVLANALNVVVDAHGGTIGEPSFPNGYVTVEGSVATVNAKPGAPICSDVR